MSCNQEMEKSQKYPLLSRYCHCWSWKVQFRVIKPKKQKKEWIDVAEIMGEDVDDAHRSIQIMCEQHGWKLVEVFLLQPIYLVFAFDRDGEKDDFLPREMTRELFPRPATRGEIFIPKSAAQLKQERKEEKHKQSIKAAFPLLDV